MRGLAVHIRFMQMRLFVMAPYLLLLLLALLGGIVHGAHQAEAAGRRLGDGAGWECTLGEDPATSCCDFVPQLEAIFAAPECAPMYGVVALALGQNSTLDVPDIPAQLDAFCPSTCAHSLAVLINAYSAKSPLGRLCPMVLDGTWRLSAMCSTDTGGAPSTSQYCLPTYVAAYEALDRVHTPLSQPQLSAICGRPCMVKLAAAAAAQAAVVSRAVLPSDTTEAGALALYAARRAGALGRIFNIICSRDPKTGQYCTLQSNIFARPDMAQLTQVYGESQPVARSLALKVVAEMGPTTSRFGPGEGLAFASHPSRQLQASAGPVPGTVVEDRGDLQDSDDFQTALNPLRRYGFVCSPCGRAIAYGLMDLSDLFGLTDPLGPANAHLVPASVSALLDQGCGINTASGNRSCLEMIAVSSQASAKYEVKLGLASAGLALCADYAAQLQNDTSTQCPIACTYALQAASTAFGCCLPAMLSLASITGRLPIVDGEKFAHVAQSQCNVPGVATGRCAASTRRFVATLLTNVRYSWVASNADRQAAVGRAWAQDLAHAVGADPSTLTVVSVMPADDAKSTIIVVAIAATSDAASVDTVSVAQSITSASAVPLTATTSALSAGADYTPSQALWDVTVPLTTADVSTAYAPAPEPLGTTSGVVASTVRMAAWVVAAVAAGALARRP